jgi:hypothetical protein
MKERIGRPYNTPRRVSIGWKFPDLICELYFVIIAAVNCLKKRRIKPSFVGFPRSWGFQGTSCVLVLFGYLFPLCMNFTQLV